MTDIAIGVIGAGGMGARHAQNIARLISGARVAAVYDLDTARAEQSAAACGGARVARDPEDLIGDAAVDAVVIASPDPTHSGLARMCLTSQKPVLCEKPLGTTPQEARLVVDAEVAGGRRMVSVGFMRRFDPQHAGVRQVIDSGQIGRPVLFKGFSRNPMIGPHLPVETLMTNSVIHDLDSTRWLMQQEITEVFVRGIRTRPTFSDATLDLLMLHLSLGDSALATIEATLAVEYGYEIAAEVVGESGTAETLQPDVAMVRSQKQRVLPVAQDWLVRFQPAYLIEVQEWTNSLREGRRFAGASAWDGYMASLIAEACVQSVRSGVAVKIPLPVMPEIYR